jgi:hypothetical protein
VREAVAEHPAAPEAALLRLSRDADERVRKAVAARAGEALAAALCQDPHPDVRRAAAKNPRTPPAVLARLIKAGATEELGEAGRPDPSLEAPALEALSKEGAFGQLLAARHPAADAALLARLSRAEFWAVRLAVARHPKTPAAAREALVGDADAYVRSTASRARAPR